MEVVVFRDRGGTLSFISALLAVWFLLFPPPAYALEAGCFCTFVFLSAMVVLGMGLTVVSKSLIAKKFWKLSWGRIAATTLLEVILLLAVLLLIQAQFYLRLLFYLPFAYLLNYLMIASKDAVLLARQTPKRRAAMAALTALVLPVAVQIIGFLATYLSSLITFKEVRV